MIFSLLKSELKKEFSLSIFSILSGISILLFAYSLSNIINNLLQIRETAASDFLMLLFAMFLKNLTDYKLHKSIINLYENIAKILRKKLHTAFFIRKEHIENADTLIIENIDAITNAIEKILPLCYSFIFHTPLFLCVIFFLDFKSSLFMLITLPIAPILLYLIGTIIKQKSMKRWEELSLLQEKFHEILNAVTIIKIFRAEDIQRERIKRLSKEFSTVSLDVLKVAFISSFAVELITTLSIAIIAVTLGFRLIAGSISFQISFFILLILPYFYRPFRQSGAAFHSFVDAKTAYENISKYFNFDVIKNITRITEKIKHPPSLTIENLIFSYGKNDKPTLSNISLTLPQNSFTLLLGESGSGKSTLLNLIANYEDDFEGEILIENYPIKNIAPENFLKHIAYAPQTPYIFNDTLRENLTVFKEVSEDKIIESIKLAALINFYKNLPNGLDTIMGKEGISLSAGERRRIGLARAILAGSPLLLLDEVTAGLDAKTEEIVLNNIEEISRRKTVLFATHREQVITRFKNHIILDGGKLIE